MATRKPSLSQINRETAALKAEAAERKKRRMSEEEIRSRAMARKVIDNLRDARVSDHDKAIIRELGECRSVNFVAEKMELDLVLTAAIIAGVV